MPIAIVTGATKGIGRAISEALIGIGYDLVVCSRNAADLDNMKNKLLSQYPSRNVTTYVADMGQKKDVLAFAENIKSVYSQIDILVNNAGVFIPGQLLEEADGTLETMIDTNLFSAYHLTRNLVNLMRPHKKGHIFNICSVASLSPYPHGHSYSISKYAMLGFGQCLRNELKPDGIKVTNIMPGATWSHAWAGATLPDDRLMQATDIAEIVVSALRLGPNACIEDIIVRPQLGDL